MVGLVRATLCARPERRGRMSIARNLAFRAAHAMMTIMRYTEAHKEAVHDRIVRAAAGALRRCGIAGIGIPALMKEAGLTHGGFYSHFKNRDALVAQAIRLAASETSQGALGDGKTLAESLRLYLSMGHVNHPEQGCVVATLAAESVRQSKPVRRACAEVVRQLLRRIDAKLQPQERTGAEPGEDALRVTATMVGAIVLARAVDDAQLAERILRAARQVAAD
jgi:TetR/AcrR family transcriptional regulator, transcriptional repressor for nem operon